MDVIRVGQRIATNRRMKNLTQKDVAEKLHVSIAAVSKWERGLNFPDMSLLEPLATLLGLTVPELLGVETQSAEQLVRDVTDLAVTQQRVDRSTNRRIVVSVCGMAIVALFYVLLMLIREGAVLSDVADALVGNGILTCLPLAFGIVSWTASIMGVLWRSQRWIWWSGGGLVSCIASLYTVIFTLDIYVRAEQFDTLMDITVGYHVAAVVLMVGTLVMAVSAAALHRKV